MAMTPGNRTINRGNRDDYRIAMKSLFMRAQQAMRFAREHAPLRRPRKRKNARKSSEFAAVRAKSGVNRARTRDARRASRANVNRAIPRNALRSECVIRLESIDLHRAERTRGDIRGPRGTGDFFYRSEKRMHLHLRNIGPALLLLLACTVAHAADHRVVVGGSFMDGGYTYPQLSFTPSTISANVGDTVTFVNGGGTHNVAADNGSFRCANGCDQSGGNGDPSGATWTSTITLTTAGTIPFHCEVHGSMGMTGTINVAGAGTTSVPITPGFTGAWYDPTQSGHGILIEVLANNQFLAWWFTFTPDGQQAWFGNSGTIDPATNTGTINALQTAGGRWIPNFDPANVTQPPWGTLTFSFTDCDHGRVDFDSSVAGYGTGHMDISRLTHIGGLACP
jgi:plastocyanin